MCYNIYKSYKIYKKGDKTSLYKEVLFALKTLSLQRISKKISYENLMDYYEKYGKS